MSLDKSIAHGKDKIMIGERQMYLNKDQEKALDIALDALGYGIQSDVQGEESFFATRIISDMMDKSNKEKRRRKK